jgi:hypothetical protein
MAEGWSTHASALAYTGERLVVIVRLVYPLSGCSCARRLRGAESAAAAHVSGPDCYADFVGTRLDGPLRQDCCSTSNDEDWCACRTNVRWRGPLLAEVGDGRAHAGEAPDGIQIFDGLNSDCTHQASRNKSAGLNPRKHACWRVALSYSLSTVHTWEPPPAD